MSALHVTQLERALVGAGKKGANPIRFDIVAMDNPEIRVLEKASYLLP